VVDNFSNSSREALTRVRELAGRDFVVHEFDLHDRGSLSRVFASGTIDAVVHLAALKSVGESSREPLRYYLNNLGGLFSLLHVMGEHQCLRLVFSSSATIYGAASGSPFAEDAPLEVTNPYARTKLIAEEVLRDLVASDSRWRIALLRYFNPVGAHPSGRIGENPRGVPNNLFPFVARVASGELPELNVFGGDYATPDGTGIRDYIHVCDLVEGHVAALKELDRFHSPEPINLGTGTGHSVLQVLDAFGLAIGRPIPRRIVGRRPGDVPVSVADASKAERILGWKSKRDLPAMCADAWRWQMQNRNIP
jgi:UDP-glucose 4-epimerase